MPDNNNQNNQNYTTFLPESPDTPPFGPPGMDVPEMPPANEEDSGPGPFLPESPDTPPFGPPPSVGEPSGPDIPTVPGMPSGPNTPMPPNRPSGPNTPMPPDRPSRPNIPGNGQRPPVTVYPIPIVPRPPQNNRQEYCTIRFLHAAVGYEAVNISIGNKPLARRLQYGEVSSYYIETTGFRIISVTDAGFGNAVIDRETFLFNADDVYTIALVNGMSGLSMFLVSDMPCRNRKQNFSCVRAVNLSYNSPALTQERLFRRFLHGISGIRYIESPFIPFTKLIVYTSSSPKKNVSLAIIALRILASVTLIVLNSSVSIKYEDTSPYCRRFTTGLFPIITFKGPYPTAA